MSAGLNRPLPLLVRRALKLLLLPLALVVGFRIEGRERLPRRRRPLVLVANHAAFVDSVYFILALRPRFAICGAKPRLFRTAARRALMAVANILEVRDHDQYLADCAALLAAGEVLLIYPEMGRNPDGMGEFETWAAEVALAAGAPVLPCYLEGTTRGESTPPRLVVGHELQPAGDALSLTARLYREVAALKPRREGAGAA
jgi:1-acyl-sn-glycerol-3-phosphate acyltransferase